MTYKVKWLVVLLFSFFSLAANGQSCQQILSHETAGSAEIDYVRIYAGKGVVIPRVIECDYCTVSAPMPSLTDSRITFLNTTADIARLQEETGGRSPEVRGTSVKCDNCGGHTALWEINRDGIPVPRVTTTRLEIHTDHDIGKRYVLLPEEYRELADKNSEMNELVRAQKLGVCESCETQSMLMGELEHGADCPNCSDHIPSGNIFDTGDLLKAADKRTKVRVRRDAGGQGATVRSRRNIQQAPERINVETVKRGRRALSNYAKKWIASSVAAVAIISGGGYHVNNTPVIAQGQVIEIVDEIATVQFQETPYLSISSDLKTYEVDIQLDETMSLPGEELLEVSEGDQVSIHYFWSDFNILPFVFHPYSGAELMDGSIVDGDSIE